MKIINSCNKLLEGNRRKLLILTGYWVLFFAPCIDEMIDKHQDRITYYSTLLYLLLIVLLLVSYFISGKHVKNNNTDYKINIKTQFYSIWLYPYRFTQIVFLLGLIWQTSYNVILMIRKTMELFDGSSSLSSLSYEQFTNRYAWVLVFGSVLMMALMKKIQSSLSLLLERELKWIVGS